MAAPIRWQFVPRQPRGNMNGATQTLPTGSGQILYYEICEADYSVNYLGTQTLQGVGRKVGIIAYDFVNTRWSVLFHQDNMLSTHQSTVYEDDIQQIKTFVATLSSPPVPITDLANDDVPWPASIPVIGAA
jgi:hypothetical protein